MVSLHSSASFATPTTTTWFTESTAAIYRDCRYFFLSQSVSPSIRPAVHQSRYGVLDEEITHNYAHTARHAPSSVKLSALRTLNLSAKRENRSKSIDRLTGALPQPAEGVRREVAGAEISILSLSESFRAARCMIIQHFWYTHTNATHTYSGAHTQLSAGNRSGRPGPG